MLLMAAPVSADRMDPSLSRLFILPGKDGCPSMTQVCPNQEAFARLASELAVTLAPPVTHGAASLGARGFALSLGGALTPISGQHWVHGTEGAGPASGANPEPDGMLAFSRLEARKGLPFGLEIGAALGRGLNTSLWVLSAELRAALFEGYRSGLGALPDVALRGVVQSMFGSSDLAIHTYAFDVTLSKPYVVAGRHTLTPLIALQTLFVSAESKPVDLTPDVSAWDTCAPAGGAVGPTGIACSGQAGTTDLEATVTFNRLDQTRIRLFVGLEAQYQMFNGSFTAGFDLTVPDLEWQTADDESAGGLSHALTLHLAAGIRY